jgi:hypothetical protein
LLQVYEGTSAVGMPLATLSGSLLPAALQVASGRFHVVFSSDSTVQGSGFVATYSTGGGTSLFASSTGPSPPSVPATPSSPAVVPIGVPSTPSTTLPSVCAESTVLQSASGALSDGTAPSYLPNQRCTWTVNAGAAATIQFQSFSLEQGYDYVRVRASPVGDRGHGTHASLPAMERCNLVAGV